MTHDIYTVDVFAQQAYAGNPLAVVAGRSFPPDNVMQNIAAETNYSETTFILTTTTGNGAYPMRVFTPSREIEFTGHPILGTAWVIRQYLQEERADRVVLDTPVGRVPVDFEQHDGEDLAWFTAPDITLGQILSAEAAAQLLGLDVADIDSRTPIQVVGSGTSAVMVPVTTQAALERSRLDLEQYAKLALDGVPPLFYVHTRETRDENNDLSVRFFFEAHGVREDPATGNGAAFVGAYLLEHGVDGNQELSLRIEQGQRLRRPSLILIRAQHDQAGRQVLVGGRVLPVMQGRLVDVF